MNEGWTMDIVPKKVVQLSRGWKIYFAVCGFSGFPLGMLLFRFLGK